MYLSALEQNPKLSARTEHSLSTTKNSLHNFKQEKFNLSQYMQYISSI